MNLLNTAPPSPVLSPGRPLFSLIAPSPRLRLFILHFPFTLLHFTIFLNLLSGSAEFRQLLAHFKATQLRRARLSLSDIPPP